MEDIIAKYNLNGEEENQFRLNLENASYAAFALAAAREVDDSFLFFIVKALLTRDPAAIDVPVESPTGFTARPAVCWLAEEYPYLMPLAVAAGVQVDQVCWVMRRRMTLLGRAAIEGSHELATKLMDLGADPNFAPEGFWMHFKSPLEIAIHNQDRTMVELLLNRGANPNYTKARFCPCNLLILALQGEDISIVHLLFFHGADWRLCDLREVALLPIDSLKWFVQESGYSPHAPAEEGRSLIELVRRSKCSFSWPGGYEGRVEILLDAGAV